LTACGVICVCGHKHQMLCGGPSCGLFAETAFFPSFQSVQRVMIGAIYSEDERENGQSHKKSERPNYSLSLLLVPGVFCVCERFSAVVRLRDAPRHHVRRYAQRGCLRTKANTQKAAAHGERGEALSSLLNWISFD
jgi:hypothetical protein